MIMRVPKNELESRMSRFRQEMDKSYPDWQLTVIFSKVNQYYFTGTMQDGMLFIHRDKKAEFWVRKSFERAVDESYFPEIMPMTSYKTAAEFYGDIPKTVYLEAEAVPLAMYQRIRKYFPFDGYMPVDAQIASVRAVKSEYELSVMKESGRIHKEVLEDLVPGMLKEGMSEAELGTQLYSAMIEKGHHGISRFGMYDTDMLIGHICFGESSIYPTFFNGPGGNYGLSPAVPSFGSRDNRLKKGTLVFVDVGCGVDGYHTDKTMTYVFGGTLPKEAVELHRKCVEIQDRIAAMLKPGAIPAEIYNSIMNSLSGDFLNNFMGYGNNKVKFLGHGIGLTIDEYPVIAEGFYKPLEEGMVIAVEPKKGIKSIGMVGIENTFLVTPEGGICITGDSKGLVHV